MPDRHKKSFKKVGKIIQAFQSRRPPKGRSFDEPEDQEDYHGNHDRKQSVVSRRQSGVPPGRRSSSESPTPQASQPTENLSLFGISKILALRNLNLKEHTKTRALTFRTVVKAIIGFIRQEKILRYAIGPVKLSQPHKFDLKRLKNYIKRTGAFSAGLSKTKQIEIKAPEAFKKKSFMDKPNSSASNPSEVKKLSAKKGGFLKASIPSDGEDQAEGSEFVREDHRAPLHPYGEYGPGWGRGYPQEFGPPGPWGWEWYERYGLPPREWYPRDEYEYHRGPDSYRPQMGLGPFPSNEYYGRNGAPRSRGGLDRGQQNPEEAMEEYRRELERTPHGERYKLAPPGYGGPWNYGRGHARYGNRVTPREDRYLRLFDSSPEHQRRGASTRDDYGYYSGPPGSKEGQDIEYEDAEVEEIEEIDARPRRRGTDSARRERRRPESPRKRLRKMDKDKIRKREDHRSLSPPMKGWSGERHRSLSPPIKNRSGGKDERTTPEEYRWGHGGMETSPRRQMMYSKSFDYDYNDPRRGYGSYPNPQEEMAKLQSVAVYATAMGGVNNEDEGW